VQEFIPYYIGFFLPPQGQKDFFFFFFFFAMATKSHAPNFNNNNNNHTHQHYTNNNINNNNNNNTTIINTIITLFNISTKNLNTLLSTTLKQLLNNPQYSHPATNPTPPNTQASLETLPPLLKVLCGVQYITVTY
jgi:hypothetical protein